VPFAHDGFQGGGTEDRIVGKIGELNRQDAKGRQENAEREKGGKRESKSMNFLWLSSSSSSLCELGVLAVQFFGFQVINPPPWNPSLFQRFAEPLGEFRVRERDPRRPGNLHQLQWEST
jgi:hypothetical protein